MSYRHAIGTGILTGFIITGLASCAGEAPKPPAQPDPQLPPGATRLELFGQNIIPPSEYATRLPSLVPEYPSTKVIPGCLQYPGVVFTAIEFGTGVLGVTGQLPKPDLDRAPAITMLPPNTNQPVAIPYSVMAPYEVGLAIPLLGNTMESDPVMAQFAALVLAKECIHFDGPTYEKISRALVAHLVDNYGVTFTDGVFPVDPRSLTTAQTEAILNFNIHADYYNALPFLDVAAMATTIDDILNFYLTNEATILEQHNLRVSSGESPETVIAQFYEKRGLGQLQIDQLITELIGIGAIQIGPDGKVQKNEAMIYDIRTIDTLAKYFFGQPVSIEVSSGKQLESLAYMLQGDPLTYLSVVGGIQSKTLRNALYDAFHTYYDPNTATADTPLSYINYSLQQAQSRLERRIAAKRIAAKQMAKGRGVAPLVRPLL